MTEQLVPNGISTKEGLSNGVHTMHDPSLGLNHSDPAHPPSSSSSSATVLAGVKQATTTNTTTALDDSLNERDLLGGLQQRRRIRPQPQISIEDADCDFTSPIRRVMIPLSSSSSSHSSPNSPARDKKKKNSVDGGLTHLLTVRAGSDPNLLSKTNSLPPGLAMNDFLSSGKCSRYYNSTRTESDSGSSDASSRADSRLGAASSKKEKGRKGHRKKRLQSVDSEDLSSSFSEATSSEETEATQDCPLEVRKTAPELSVDTFDDVFQEGVDVHDEKLVDWAFNVFLPACRTLLCHCAEEEELRASSIQYDLRNLSNTIDYFCTEQQKLSGILKSRGMMTLSLSTDRFQRLAANRFKTLRNNSSMSATGEPGSNADPSESEDQYDRGYAVKILRSVSQSLIAPLLHDAERGFTQELYKSIVQAIQKISWKVEACLSFNQPGKDYVIHSEIFDAENTDRLRAMMIGALPPEEPKLPPAPRGARSNSISSRKQSESAHNPTTSGVALRRSSSSRIRPTGTVFDPDKLPTDLKGSNNDSNSCNNNADEQATQERDEEFGGVVSPLENFSSSSSSSSSAAKRRIRTSTTGHADGVMMMSSPKHTSKGGGMIRQGSSERLVESTGPNGINYFRPTANRRTTVSLSKKEVSSLGLTMAQRVDKSMGKEVQRSSSEVEREESHLGLDNETSMEEVSTRLHMKLTEQFDRIRSASLSDLLDADDDTPAPLASCRQISLTEVSQTVPCSKSSSRDQLVIQTAYESDNELLSPHLNRCYTSLNTKRKDSGGWVYIDPVATDESRSYLPELASKDAKSKGSKLKTKSRQVLARSINASGRFTQSIMKTAKALRRGSTSRFSQSSTVEVMSVKSVSEMTYSQASSESAKVKKRPFSSAEPASPKAVTMPTKRRIGTFTRLAARKKDKAKSFSNKGDATSPRKSEFLKVSNEEIAAGNSVFLLESIENYSKNAVRALPLDEGEDQLLVSVAIADKVSGSKSSKKKSSLKDHSSTWFEITVNTNIKQLGRNHYTVLRSLKQVLNLYDTLASRHSCLLPERPDKKLVVRKQRQQLEELLRYIAGNPALRGDPTLVGFLMPDDEFGSLSKNDSEVNFELLMTFYTPDVYPGPPGANQGIMVVSAEDVPGTPSPPRPRKHSTLPKRGSMHYYKKDGKEDPSTFVIKEEGQDALIVAYEDDRYVVVAGTFDKLVEQLACEEKPDPRFVLTFLYGYRHFSAASELLSLLLARFHMTVPPDATEEEMAYNEKWRYVIQLRVLDILAYWLKKCWPDFHSNPAVLEKVQEFISSIQRSEDTNFKLAGNNLEKILHEKSSSRRSKYPSLPGSEFTDGASLTKGAESPSTPVSSHLPTPPGGSPFRRSVSSGNYCVDSSTLTAIQLARQLTLIELDFVRAIDTHELVVYMWNRTPANEPYWNNLKLLIERFNKVSYWVASEICTVADAKLRGALIEKFIEMAKHCQEYKNFNTTISVVSGLSLAAVRRLKRSWENVSEKAQRSFHKMYQISSPTNNHTNYRKALAAVHRRDPCIPYFGVYVRDLTFFNDGTHKTLSNGLLNFSKLRTMVLKFEELKKYQRSKYFFPQEDRIRDFCCNLWCLPDSELYEASLTAEPREPPAEPLTTDL